MDSRIRQAARIKYEPVAVLLTDEKPEKASQFKEGGWGCVMFMLAAAAKGRTAVFDRKTFGCPGGGVGLGFGPRYKDFVGGEAGFCHFLSTGYEQSAEGREMLKKARPFLREETLDNFLYGERYIKTPELVADFIKCLPIMDLPFEYVVFKPLRDVDPAKEKPVVIVFLTDMDQLSALVVLANYARPGNQNVIIPQAAGCQLIGIIPFHEAESETPRAVVGLVDLSARLTLKRQLKEDLMTFAIPYALFEEMESSVAGSFLERTTWQTLLAMREESPKD
jgi:uncharacterized protein (DUF169 family)